ncbi:MAG TPA: hypothetical protein VG708_04130 [Mycobacteriales bacterium]|nr:hypothetical protein [Mycobacteriales bacterium]
MPRRRDALAAARVAGDGLAGTARTVRDVHLAVADRVFRYVGPQARPVRLAHDGISRVTYAAVGAGVRGLAEVGGRAAAIRQPAGAASQRITDHPTAAGVIGALNGAWGDYLSGRRSPLALDMTIRRHGRDVPPTEADLAAAFSDASSDVVVFLHGLCETDRAWWLGAAKHYGDNDSTHGSRLAVATGATPVYLRYNTGHHISDNGQLLAALLADLVTHWPVPISRLTLVGHSMGALVIRSACAQADGEEWLDRVQRCVYLGGPHLGAPLELAATAAGLALARFPETKPLSQALATRSSGIKDLRYGDIAAADWAEITDPDAWRAEPAACLPLLASVTHYYVGVTLTRSNRHPVARVIGDAFVTWPSAGGRSRRRDLALAADCGRHLGGLHHFDLLNHPRVWAVLEEWLG